MIIDVSGFSVTIASVIFVGGGFFALTNWRIKKLEDRIADGLTTKLDDVHDWIVRQQAICESRHSQSQSDCEMRHHSEQVSATMDA